MELKRHQHRFGRTHQQRAAAEGNRDQDEDEEPIGRIEGELGPEGEAHDDRAPDQDDESDRTVTGLFGMEVEAAIREGGCWFKEAGEELALPTARADARKASG